MFDAYFSSPVKSIYERTGGGGFFNETFKAFCALLHKVFTTVTIVSIVVSFLSLLLRP